MLCCRVIPAAFIMDFYKTTKWIALRNSILRRDGYMCQISKRYGKLKQAEMVHHIFPRDDFPEYQYAPWNLISITRSAHKDLHDQNTGELTKAGLELLRRTALKNGIAIPDKYRTTKRTMHREQISRYEMA